MNNFVLEMAWHRIESGSYVNGPGQRTVLWLTGCPIRCPGCQNHSLWAESAATHHTAPAILAQELRHLAGDEDLTITGGEPFLQFEALGWLLVHIRFRDRAAGLKRNVVVYTGYTWEDLLDLAEAFPTLKHVLTLIDVLVDGPYLASQDDATIQWRGSRNQRAIDVQASIAAGALDEPACSLRGDPDGDDRLVLLDWDTPVLTLAPGGRLFGAAGLVRELFDGAASTARCGQVPDGDK